MSHASLSFFPALVGNSARFGNLSTDLAIFLWHIAGIFLLMLGSWKLAHACFESDRARWGAVCLVAGVFSVPVAGTALAVMDPYVTARSLSTPATLLAIAACVANQPKPMFLWLAVTALVHPQMSAYAALFLVILTLARRGQMAPPGIACLAGVPFLYEFAPAQGPAREALFSRTYFFLSNWTWYEWVGVFAPLALFLWFSRTPLRQTTSAFRLVTQAAVPFGLMFTLAGVALLASPRLENFARLQPMRSFHLLYLLMFLLVGGLIAEYALGARPWRWVALFLPLAAGMYLLQRNAFPSSLHVELPGLVGCNPWTSAFLWIREHTPRRALFALDPNYMRSPGADQHGFRAIAERSVLADNLKDSGAVSLFPQLARRWKVEVQAQTGWARFGLADFRRLARRHSVTWIVTRRSGSAGLPCPYTNSELAVCRVE
jgi:hypothetical protein